LPKKIFGSKGDNYEAYIIDLLQKVTKAKTGTFEIIWNTLIVRYFYQENIL